MTNQLQADIKTHSERFMNEVVKQFAAQTSNPIAFTDYQKTLAQHLFLKMDMTLKTLESKRNKEKQKLPYEWTNINMKQLSLDAAHVVMLGLDALISNHVHPVPYKNGAIQKYDLDLRVGYVGKAYYRMQAAIEQPKDMIIELVHDTDHFKPIKRSIMNAHESYEFDIKNPFKRGEVIGGFGYLVYEDSSKNQLIIVSEDEFLKSKSKAQSDKFWKDHPNEMRYKTLVHRVTEKLHVDPCKVNAAYLYAENQKDETPEDKVRNEINEHANSETIDADYQVLDSKPFENSNNTPNDKPISKPNDYVSPGQLDIYDLPQSSTDTYMDGPGF